MALQNMVASIKAPKFIRELDQLVKAIGECKSKAEEDRIILQEVEVLKQRLHDPKLDKSRGREYMVRLMYCEMLGHDVGFAYIHTLQFCSDANLSTKKVGHSGVGLREGELQSQRRIAAVASATPLVVLEARHPGRCCVRR
jgi:AP-4 complex subunit epsilon-1